MQRAHRHSIGVMLAAIMLLALVSACGLVSEGLQRGMLPPLEFSLDVGLLQFRTLVIDDLHCLRPIPAGSIAAMCSPRTLFTTERYYSGWIETHRRVAGRIVPRYRRIFAVRLPM